MQKSNRKKERGHQHTARAKRRVPLMMLAAFGVALVVLATGLILIKRERNEHKSPVTGSGNDPVETIAPVRPDFQTLKGQWQRPDGGYVIDITSMEANGKLQAGYYNPRPIHVARAETALEGEIMTVFIELNDVNYPGSTYTLRYHPDVDQLHGVYYQAALQQSFEVVFVRIK